nr:MAG TPA: hypothetical protein [Caudoviricetes sp.]
MFLLSRKEIIVEHFPYEISLRNLAAEHPFTNT